MTLDAWKKEFYFVDACLTIDNDIEATRASLKKWRGLTPENLDKHSLTKDGIVLKGLDSLTQFRINCENCSLCIRTYDEEEDESDCNLCPISRLPETADCIHEFTQWANTGDAQPMIELLEKTLKMLLLMQTTVEALEGV